MPFNNLEDVKKIWKKVRKFLHGRGAFLPETMPQEGERGSLNFWRKELKERFRKVMGRFRAECEERLLNWFPDLEHLEVHAVNRTANQERSFLRARGRLDLPNGDDLNAMARMLSEQELFANYNDYQAAVCLERYRRWYAGYSMAATTDPDAADGVALRYDPLRRPEARPEYFASCLAAVRRFRTQGKSCPRLELYLYWFFLF